MRRFSEIAWTEIVAAVALENLVKNEKLQYVDYSKQRMYVPSQKKAMLVSPEMQIRSCL
jgi:hypothetical protein